MNILLIYPEFPDTFWSFRHALEFVGKRAALPPLGLLTVASLLPPEWSQRLVDTNVRRLTKKDPAWADGAFISAMVVQRAGLQVQGGFIVGFDHDRPSIFQRQIDFIQNSGIATAMVGLLQAPPGTRLYERMKKEGRIRGDSSGDNVDGTTNIIPASTNGSPDAGQTGNEFPSFEWRPLVPAHIRNLSFLP